MRHRYVTDLDAFASQAKLEACPHCRRVGTLIGHGRLQGYADDGAAKVLRGRRFFCSNRRRKTGCGRTFSVVLADVLAGFVVRLGTLRRFVDAVVGGASRRAAWRANAGTMASRSGYRLWACLRAAQVAIRPRLHRHCPPPPSDAKDPMAQLLAHLRCAFPSAACPLAAYQLHFKLGLFG